MISIDNLVDMIATEVLEQKEEYKLPERDDYLNSDLEPINYTLELIRNPDGTYNWEE